MKRRKLAKRVKRLEQRVAELEGARMWEPPASTPIVGPDMDPQLLLRDAVVEWMHYWEDDDGEEWSPTGYL